MSGLRRGPAAQDIARHIRRMAQKVRGAVRQAPGGGSSALAGLAGRELTGRELAGLDHVGQDHAGQGQAEQEQRGSGPGWWVLAQGGPLDEGDFAAREAAREELLARVRRAGILVGENVWVWDLSGRAQLVLTTLPTLERARKVAQRLRGKGLAIVVRREMGEDPTGR